MGKYPDRCPKCGEPNDTDVDYCPVCGIRFSPLAANKNVDPAQTGKKKKSSKEMKLRLKRQKKKKELDDLFRKKKISRAQYVKGLRKLGFASDVDKALEFKKYIREQIKAFEKMDVDKDREGEYRFDPNASKADLPRDEYGNPITDFSVSPHPPKNLKREEPPPSYDHSAADHNDKRASVFPSSGSGQGPLFGDSLFGDRGTIGSPGQRRSERTARSNRPGGDRARKRASSRGSRRIRGKLEWDEEEEEEEFELEEEIEEGTREELDFEIDLDEEGEKGWWDDDEWELEWTEEDEEEWEDWGIDEVDEEDEESEVDEGWDMVFGEDDEGEEKSSRNVIEWDDEAEEEEEADVDFEDETVEFLDEDDENEDIPIIEWADEDEAEDWGTSRSKKRRRRNR